MSNFYLKLDTFYKCINYCLFDYWHQVQDPRTKDYPLIDVNFVYPIIIMYMFYYLVKYYIPNRMKDREPCDLRKTILTYNACMAMLNLGAFKECLTRFHWSMYLDFVYPTDKSDTQEIRIEMVLSKLTN